MNMYNSERRVYTTVYTVVYAAMSIRTMTFDTSL